MDRLGLNQLQIGRNTSEFVINIQNFRYQYDFMKPMTPRIGGSGKRRHESFWRAHKFTCMCRCRHVELPKFAFQLECLNVLFLGCRSWLVVGELSSLCNAPVMVRSSYEFERVRAHTRCADSRTSRCY